VSACHFEELPFQKAAIIMRNSSYCCSAS